MHEAIAPYLTLLMQLLEIAGAGALVLGFILATAVCIARRVMVRWPQSLATARRLAAPSWLALRFWLPRRLSRPSLSNLHLRVLACWQSWCSYEQLSAGRRCSNSMGVGPGSDRSPTFGTRSTFMTGATWVFGYGSLIWHQDFPYLDARDAWIEGWTRRFWQGSHDHRGTETDPGRVLTLIKSPGERCYGRAFLVEPSVFEHLDYREKNGYERIRTETYFEDAQAPGVVYVADEDNVAFLGDAPAEDIAAQIRRSAGPSGNNSDYVLELACILRELGIDDPHVFEIEALLLGASDEKTEIPD